MPLLGMFGSLFWAGVAIYLAGFLLVWRMVSKYGGMERSRTIDVVFGDDSPMKRPEARRDRAWFRVGAFAMGIGVMNVFTALSVGEERELRVCRDACRNMGYPGGQFAPSAFDRDAEGHARRGCFCAGPAGSVEIQKPRLGPGP